MKTETDKKRTTKRRGNGEGSIFQRKDGRWSARVTIGYGADGKRKCREVYGWTKAEVQKKLTTLMAQKQAGSLCDAGRETVAEFVSWWLTNEVKPNRRASTHNSYQQIAEKLILPHVGGLQLSRLLPANVGSLYATLQSNGRSARRVQMVHAVLRRSMERAMKLGKVVRNPCDAVERPQAPRHEITPLDQDQAKALFEAASRDRLHALYILAIASGLRQGELFALRWEDVDLTEGLVSVRRTVVQVDEEFIVNEPKTARGRRRVEIPPIAVEALRDHQARLLKEGFAGDGRVFVSRTGNYLRRNAVRKSLLAILRRAGLPAIRFHDLRHTCASLLMLGGEHIKVVQERLGHSTSALTMDTYSHVLPTMQRAAANKLDAMLTKTGS